MKQRKSVLIINPVSGIHNKDKLLLFISAYFAKNKIECKIVKTTHIGHAIDLTRQHAEAGFNHFVVAGGDGTINEVAGVLIEFDHVSLGILALGSGNGLARHLKLPKKLSNALDIAFGDKIVTTDTGLLNGKPFFSVAGVGFDAFIAHRFSEMKNRGFRNYVKAVLKNYVRYKPQHYKINLGEQKLETHALMITFANSNQFGNNTSIAPKANISDGLIDLCIMRKPAAVAAVFLAPMLFLKKMDRTRFLKIYRTNRIEVETTLPAFIHFDGDPYILEKSKIVFEMIPASLNIHV